MIWLHCFTNHTNALLKNSFIDTLENSGGGTLPVGQTWGRQTILMCVFRYKKSCKEEANWKKPGKRTPLWIEQLQSRTMWHGKRHCFNSDRNSKQKLFKKSLFFELTLSNKLGGKFPHASVSSYIDRMVISSYPSSVFRKGFIKEAHFPCPIWKRLRRWS